jgi:hypothetical protein
MSDGAARYALGIVSLLLISGSVLLGAAGLRRRYFDGWSGAFACLAQALIAVAMLIGILELLGAVGLFRLVPIVVVCVAVGGGIAIRTRRDGTLHARADASAPPGIVATIAVLAVATVAAEWASPTLQAYHLGSHTFDSLWYHLPWAAGFAQTGHITQLHYDLEFLLAFYPATGELLHGLGIVLFGHDTVSPALNLLWMGLSLLAAWCVGLPSRVGASSVWAVAIVLATPMLYFSQPGSADVDILGVFFLLGAAALLVAAEDRRPRDQRAAFVLAAISAGLAISVKLTFVVPVVALSLGVVALAPSAARARRAGLWVGPLVAGGGFWYLRNLIAVGNPLPWSGFGILPTPSPPLEQSATFSVAHYLTSSRFWDRYFVPGISSQLGRWWYVLVAVAVLGPLLCLLPGAGRTVRMLALVALCALIAYLLTPNGAAGPEGHPIAFAFNLRFALPALALGFAVTPLAPVLRRRPAVRGALLAVLVVVFAATVDQANLWPHQHYRAAVGFGVVVLALGMLVVSARRVLWRGRAGRIVLAAGAVILLGAGAAAGYPWQQRYLRGRYGPKPKTSNLARVWDYFRGIRHTRIGLVGTYGEFFSYPMMGNDDSNRVQYIARYGPHGAFTLIKTCREFRRAVSAGRFRYLVTTPTRNFWDPHRLFYSPEGSWTISDPGAHLMFSYLAAGRRVSLFELSGQLHPAACA